VPGLILVTGGSRSGKSAFAQQLAEAIPGPRIFLATCPRTDSEMEERIRRHREDRKGRGWQSIEVEIDLVSHLADIPPATTVLIDCLTLWINNLMYAARRENRELTEDGLAGHADRLAGAAHTHDGTVILVTNEVGLGIVPDNPLARRYRDLVGRCNQVVAARADQVFLVTCGIAQQIKG
jgi:adenosylcobinamide kinase/adenosylcobinamide-phosphate guanylyltransferase